ncbi:MAG: FtsH protease activity modulator HflK [Myxococcota bacterium]
MAERDEELSADEKVRRSVTRTIGNSLFAIAVLVGLGAWSWFYGQYQLYPGQSAIILRLGQYARTVTTAGLKFHLPAPLETHEIVKVAEVRKEEFGVGGVHEGATDVQAIQEASMQTRDNAIVRLAFVVQYRYSNAFQSRYSLEDPEAILRDAAQAAAREVVGQMTIEDVLSLRRDDVAADTEQILQASLDRYGSGIVITEVLLQEVQPPEEVRQAFDDVVAAGQDASRAVNEAEGYRNALPPPARAAAAESVAAASGYRDSKIAESAGEAARFLSIEAEYRKAPQVTRTRLYLETMEAVLPSVAKVVIESGTTQVLPYLPLRPPSSPQRAPQPRPPNEEGAR